MNTTTIIIILWTAAFTLGTPAIEILLTKILKVL